MGNMAKMFNMSRDDHLQRKEKLHDNLVKLDTHQVKLATQVDHLTCTVHSFRDQLDTNADFAVGAVQQVRDEMNTRFKAVEQAHQDAPNAGPIEPALRTRRRLQPTHLPTLGNQL